MKVLLLVFYPQLLGKLWVPLSLCLLHRICQLLTEPLVDQVVDSISHLVDPTLPIESEIHTTQVLLVTSDSSTLGAFYLFLQNHLQVLRSFPLIGID